MEEASVDQMLTQANLVLNHYIERRTIHNERAVNRVHFNWMARGDAMHSYSFRQGWERLSTGLQEMAEELGVTDVRFNISTIFPKDRGLENTEWFKQFDTTHKPTFFYSLYSMDDEFRRQWLPKAVEPSTMLDILRQWQELTGQEIVLHWALIKGQNDSEQQVAKILRAVEYHRIKARFNLVRYNPFTSLQGEESDPEVITERFAEIEQSMKLAGSRIVPRVGFDVKASCGMFVKQY